MNTHDKVAVIIKDVLGREIEINPETKLLEDMGMDSLTLVQLLMSLEDQFAIDIPTEELQIAFTVKDLCRIVDNTRANGTNR